MIKNQKKYIKSVENVLTMKPVAVKINKDELKKLFKRKVKFFTR